MRNELKSEQVSPKGASKTVLTRGAGMLGLGFLLGLAGPVARAADQSAAASAKPEAVQASAPGAAATKECGCTHGAKEHPADCQCDACDCSKGGECSHGKCHTAHKGHGAKKAALKKVPVEKKATSEAGH